MKFYWLLTGILIALTGCTEPASENSPASSTTPLPPPPPPGSIITPSNPGNFVASQNRQISAGGIGSAKLGMTLGELKQQLGANTEFTVESPYIVDFDAIAVSQGGIVEYYILYPAGKPLKDSDIIEALLTENSQYRTDKNVGPGTSLKKAEEAYGDATLSYNLVNEGREYVKFASGPAKNIAFRLGSAGASLAGVYPNISGEYQETKEYRENATIRSVQVNCLGGDCSKL